MDCNRCAENMTAYLDGELSPSEYAQTHTHLLACTGCYNELRGLRAAVEFVVSHASELELPPESWNSLRVRLCVPKAPSFWSFPIQVHWRPAIAATAFFIVLALGYMWHQQVQKENLDDYIAQYEKARAAGRSLHRAITGADARFKSGNIDIENPFVEARVGIDLNPFRSEDR